MSQETPLVSVIVPCYNYGRFLGDTLDSLIEQTYNHWECIIVDDGSTDTTRSIAESYVSRDDRIKYFFQANGGLSAARNTGLRRANGEYIQLLDADDLLTSRKLDIQVSILEENTIVDIVYGNVFLFEKKISALDKAQQIHLQTPESGSGMPVLLSLVKDNMFLVHCALFRSSILQEIGFFNESMITCEDWNFWFRCAVFNKNFLYTNEYACRVYVRNHGSNMSWNRKNMWLGRIFFRKEAIKIIDDNREIQKSEIGLINMQQYYIVASHFELAYGSVFEGFLTLIRSVYYNRNILVIRDSMYWLKERLLGRL
jgi:glycosyltransferase involved in cell wall biosynthesis